MKGGDVGAGIRAGDLPPELQRALDNMKDQLILVLLRRLQGIGNDVHVPIAEVDDTGGLLMSMRIDYTQKEFVFRLEKKQ